MATRNLIQVRRGYSMGATTPINGYTIDNNSQWNCNSTLQEGEIGYEIDTGRFKIGKLDLSGNPIGWCDLDYAGGGGGYIISSGLGYVPSSSGDDTLYSILRNDTNDTNITIDLANLSDIISGASGTYYKLGLADNLTNINNITISGDLSANDGTFSGDVISNGRNLTSIVRKLIPPEPPTLNGVSLTWSDTPALASKKLCHGFSPNLNGNSVTLTAGQSYSTDFDNDYITSIVSNVGPGESGTVLTVIKNTASAGTRTLTNSSDVGTYNDLRITEDKDYSTVNTAVASGFWQVYSVRASGTSSTGWNTVKITSVPGGETSTLSWYYDNFTTAPSLTNGAVATGVGSLVYSSSVPHYSGNFNISFNAQYLSGDTYVDSFIGAVNNSAGLVNFGPLFRTNVGLLEDLTRNYASTPVAVSITGIAAKANTFSAIAPTSFMQNISVSNSYTSSNIQPQPANTVLIKTLSGPNASFLQEDNIPVGNITQLGSSYTIYGSRLSGYGTTDNPTGTPAAWNSSSSLGQYDAAVVGGILSHNLTNYSTGYTPVGPNLSSSPRGSSPQYFTFKVTRNSVSRLIIKIGSGATGISGLWFRLPGSAMDTSLSSTNGWATANLQYNSTTGFTSSSTGCAESTVVPLNSQLSHNTNYIITFGTNSSTDSNDEIHVRIKLITGQTITALSLQGI